jgi:hypothetical protein
MVFADTHEIKILLTIDLLFPFFINRDLMKARVALKPRWQEDKVEPLVVQGLVTAVAPFEPNFFIGHFYFPDYKKSRVLVALDFHSARIERFLNWRGGARLPMDSQGNHMLLGKSEKSQASLKHVYVDDKPVLEMKRTSGKDSEMIKMIEGSLILETKEE